MPCEILDKAPAWGGPVPSSLDSASSLVYPFLIVSVGQVRTRRSKAMSWCLALFIVASCRGRSCDEDGAQQLVISQMQLEVVTHDNSGRPRVVDLEIDRIVEEALNESRELRYRPDGAKSTVSISDGVRLRLDGQISRDASAGELHALVKARIDRTNSIILSWSVDNRLPFDGDKTVDQIDRQILLQHLEGAVRDVIAALDAQARTSRCEPRELVKALRSDEQPKRLAAARTLGMMKHLPAVQPLCRALDGSEEQVVQSVTDALADIGDDRAVGCLSQWSGSEPRKLAQAIHVSSRVGGSKAIDFLDEVAVRDDAPQWVKALAKGKLRRFRGNDDHEEHADDHDEHDETLRNDPFIRALSDNDAEIRIGAIELLVSQRRTDAVEPLCELLDHEDSRTVEAALGALAELRHPRAVPCLVRWSTRDPRRLPPVIEALSFIGGSEARTVLELLVREHHSPQIREAARVALERAAENRE